MSNDINWANLVANGRAKAHGIPWTEEEAAARAAGVPADYVRQGFLTVEDYQAEQKKDEQVVANGGEKDINKMTKAELQTKATELGIVFTPSATVAALREIILNKLNEKSSDDESDEESEGKDDDE